MNRRDTMLHLVVFGWLKYSDAMKKKKIACVTELEEPYEGRLSRTVLWEGKGEIPLSDPISGKG